MAHWTFDKKYYFIFIFFNIMQWNVDDRKKLMMHTDAVIVSFTIKR